MEKAKEERGLPEGDDGGKEAGDDEEGGMGVSKLSQEDGDNVDYNKQEQVIMMVVMMVIMVAMLMMLMILTMVVMMQRCKEHFAPNLPF